MPLDIGVGIIGSIIFVCSMGVDINSTILFVGILFSLLPDLDFLFYLKKGGMGKFGHKHRNLFHYPLLFLPTGFIALSLFSLPYGIFFLALSIMHFVHDSVGIGWGIQWAYPFSRKYIKFFSNQDGSFGKGIAIWTPLEQDRVAEEKGDENWIRNIYLTVNQISLAEYGVFILAIILYLFFK